MLGSPVGSFRQNYLEREHPCGRNIIAIGPFFHPLPNQIVEVFLQEPKPGPILPQAALVDSPIGITVYCHFTVSQDHSTCCFF